MLSFLSKHIQPSLSVLFSPPLIAVLGYVLGGIKEL